MKTKNIRQRTFRIDTSKYVVNGESLEEKLRRMKANKEPIETQVTPPIYQERNEGINPNYDIRTDKFEIAQDSMDKVTATNILARNNKQNFGADLDKNSVIIDNDGNIVVTPKEQNV